MLELSSRRRYIVVLEQTPNNSAAYVRDVGGCVATAPTREEVLEKIQSALAFHFEGMVEAGELLPEPGSWTASVDVELPAGARFTPSRERAETR